MKKVLDSIICGLCLALAMTPLELYAAPATVNTATAATATSGNSRKTFYDEINRMHWAAYYNGSAIEFSYTDNLDGGTWTSAGTLAYDSAEFALTYKTISGVPYVIVAATANTYDIVLRRGVVGATSIAFDAEVTALDGTAADDAYSAPSIALDGNNKLWVAAVWDISELEMSDKVVATVRSSASLTDNIGGFEPTIRLGKPDRFRTSVSLFSDGVSHIYLASGPSSDNLDVWGFDGATWLLKSNGGDVSWSGTETSPISSSAKITIWKGNLYASGSFGLYRWDGSVWVSVMDAVGQNVQIVYPDGNDLYVGGNFVDAGGIPEADYIARWDGTQWHALGSGTNGQVSNMTIFDGDLYITGEFLQASGVTNTLRIARWDGTQWHSLGTGLNNPAAWFVELGTDLYIGGTFSNVNGIASADYIARWNGSSWSALGAGLNGGTYGAVTMNGSLYVRGNFSNAGGFANADRIARWNGSAWQELGLGIASGTVYDIATDGNNVFVGGWFSDAGGVASADCIARWDGDAWHGLGAGITTGAVQKIAIDGSDIYVGGQFTDAGGNLNADRIARWDGSNWHELATGLNNIVSYILVDNSQLYVSGSFTDVNNQSGASYIARWDGVSWNAYSAKFVGTITSAARIGAYLYFAGSFTSMGETSGTANIARWDGSSWHDLSGGLNGSVAAIATSDNELYVGGNFTNAGGDPNADYIARWDGGAWHPLGTGTIGAVNAITISGNDIYVGGSFTSAGGVANTSRIARWDGTSWHAIGNGLVNSVRAIAVHGSKIYAGGVYFWDVGSFLAYWDGTTWGIPGNGIQTGPVSSLAVIDNDIYIGGTFTNVDSVANTNYVVRWDGASWRALDLGLSGAAAGLTPFNGDLYVAGNFSTASNIANTSAIARWDGSTWHPICDGLQGSSSVLLPLGDVIFVGGNLSSSGDGETPLTGIARCGPTTASDFSSSSYISGTTDSAGDLHLLYSNNSDELVYRRYDNNSTSWQPSVTLASGATIDSLGLSLSATEELQALWLSGNSIQHKDAVAPYNSGDWAAVADTLYSTGTNTGLSVGSGEQWGRIPYFWTHDGGSPYNVMVDSLDFTLDITGTIDDGTNPLVGVTVDAGIHGDTTTDGSGNYTISGIPHGQTYTLTPSITGYTFTSTASGTLTATTIHDFTANINTYNITGQIVVDGTPVAGVIIDGGALGTTVTDSSGNYAFNNVAHGTNYTISAHHNYYTFPSNISGTLTGDITPSLGVTRSAYDISGSVTLENMEQTSLPGVEITCGERTTTTNNSGNYHLTAIPIGTHTVSANLPGYSFTPASKKVTLTTTDATALFSAKPVVANPAFAFWNGFLGMINVLEIMNTGNEELELNLLVYSNGGSGNNLNRSWTVPPMTQRDIILNDLEGFAPDTYGMVQLQGSHNSFDGRVTIYHPDSSGEMDSQYGFAFAEPLRNSNLGQSAAMFNSYHPGNTSSAPANTVYNWLTIGNLSSAAKSFTVKRYNISGEKVAEERVSVPPFGRRDIDGGHINPGPDNVGTNMIIPDDTASPYLSSIVRYAEGSNFNNYDYSFSLPATTGAIRTIYAPISISDVSENYVEVANMLDEDTNVQLKFIDADGYTLATNNISMPALSQRHFPTMGLLSGDSNTGYVAITPSTPNSVVAQSVFYYRDRTSRAMETSYASVAREAYGKKLYTTYNMFLGMDNMLRLMNLSTEQNDVTYTLNGLERSFTDTAKLDSSGSVEAKISSAARRDSYGLVTISTSVPGSVASELVRIRKLASGKTEFAISTPAK
ncbi:MAG: hypothetical protein PHC51_07540 [bacterium]|nr:hypothetical protein [bacterium]